MKKVLAVILLFLMLVLPLYAKERLVGSGAMVIAVDDSNASIYAHSGYTVGFIKEPDKVIELLKTAIKYFETASSKNVSYTKFLGKQDCFSFWFSTTASRQLLTIYIVDTYYGWDKTVYIGTVEQINELIDVLNKAKQLSADINSQFKALESVR